MELFASLCELDGALKGFAFTSVSVVIQDLEMEALMVSVQTVYKMKTT